jgi:hypothetical protein
MITKVTTNLKSETGASRTFNLSQRTLICGPSASGKSAVINALELESSGRMTDYLGRGDAAARTIQECLTRPEVALESSVERSNDQPVALPYAATLAAILSNPLDAHLNLLGSRLPSDVRDLANELRTVSKQQKELRASIERAEMLQEYLKGELECDSVRAQEKLLEREDKDEVELQALDAKVVGLKEAVAMGIRAAWTPTVLAEVTRWIPKQLGTFAIYSAGDSLSLRLGLSRDGVGSVRWALSGSEWNVVVTALAHLDATDDTHCIIPADRAIDHDLLTAWMKTLATSPAQILLTAIAPPDSVPRGWEVLNIGSLRAKATKAKGAGRDRQAPRAKVAHQRRTGVRPHPRGR